MAITVADNFSYQGKKPLDGRDGFDTLAQMKAYPEASVYDGCMTYCKEDEKYYTFKASNTVDATTGKWREFSTGGGGQTYNDFTGATASTDGAHGLVPAPSAGDEGKVLFGNGAWGALPSVDLSVLSNEAFQLSATEKAIGTWTDSNNVTKILYAKTIKGTSPSNSTDTVIYTFNSDEECVTINGALLSGCVPINYTGSSSNWYSRCYVENSNPDRLHLQVAGYTNAPYSIAVFYTKTTDSPLPSDVKFAGVDENGNVIYKQTITGLSIGLVWDGQANASTNELNPLIENVIPYRCHCIGINGGRVCADAHLRVLGNGKWKLYFCNDFTINTMILYYTLAS